MSRFMFFGVNGFLIPGKGIFPNVLSPNISADRPWKFPWLEAQIDPAAPFLSNSPSPLCATDEGLLGLERFQNSPNQHLTDSGTTNNGKTPKFEIHNGVVYFGGTPIFLWKMLGKFPHVTKLLIRAHLKVFSEPEEVQDPNKGELINKPLHKIFLAQIIEMSGINKESYYFRWDGRNKTFVEFDLQVKTPETRLPDLGVKVILTEDTEKQALQIIEALKPRDYSETGLQNVHYLGRYVPSFSWVSEYNEENELYWATLRDEVAWDYWMKRFDELCSSLKALNPDQTVILPVPSSKNISSDFAKRVAKKIGATFIESPFHAVREIMSQKEMPGNLRSSNLMGAFVLNNGVMEEINGRNIIIVDDLVTTGSTFRAIDHALRQADVGEIHHLALVQSMPLPREDEDQLNTLRVGSILLPKYSLVPHIVKRIYLDGIYHMVTVPYYWNERLIHLMSQIVISRYKMNTSSQRTTGKQSMIYKLRKRPNLLDKRSLEIATADWLKAYKTKIELALFFFQLLSNRAVSTILTEPFIKYLEKIHTLSFFKDCFSSLDEKIYNCENNGIENKLEKSEINFIAIVMNFILKARLQGYDIFKMMFENPFVTANAYLHRGTKPLIVHWIMEQKENADFLAYWNRLEDAQPVISNFNVQIDFSKELPPIEEIQHLDIGNVIISPKSLKLSHDKTHELIVDAEGLAVNNPLCGILSPFAGRFYFQMTNDRIAITIQNLTKHESYSLARKRDAYSAATLQMSRITEPESKRTVAYVIEIEQVKNNNDGFLKALKHISIQTEAGNWVGVTPELKMFEDQTLPLYHMTGRIRLKDGQLLKVTGNNETVILIFKDGKLHKYNP